MTLRTLAAALRAAVLLWVYEHCPRWTPWRILYWLDERCESICWCATVSWKLFESSECPQPFTRTCTNGPPWFKCYCGKLDAYSDNEVRRQPREEKR